MYPPPSIALEKIRKERFGTLEANCFLKVFLLLRGIIISKNLTTCFWYEKTCWSRFFPCCSDQLMLVERESSTKQSLTAPAVGRSGILEGIWIEVHNKIMTC